MSQATGEETPVKSPNEVSVTDDTANRRAQRSPCIQKGKNRLEESIVVHASLLQFSDRGYPEASNAATVRTY